MYTKKLFGKELKNKLLMNISAHDIGHWVYTVYLEQDVEPRLDDILLTLNTMEDGSEFAFSYEELNQIADDLIAGKDVNFLDP